MCEAFNVIAGTREYLKDKVIEAVIEAFNKQDEEDLVIVFKGYNELKFGRTVEFWDRDNYNAGLRGAIDLEDRDPDTSQIDYMWDKIEDLQNNLEAAVQELNDATETIEGLRDELAE